MTQQNGNLVVEATKSEVQKNLMYEFKMPKLGADMDEGVLLEWKISVGDVIKKGDVVAVIETAKGAIDIEAFVDGVVSALIIQPNAEVAVGTVLAMFDNVDKTQLADTKVFERASPPLDAVEGHAKTSTRTVPQLNTAAATLLPQSDVGNRISPRARMLAKKLKVSLTTITGTGPEGSVIAKDIEAAAQGTERDTRPTKPRVDPRNKQVAMRNTIAAAMSRSKRDIPHYYLAHEIDVTAALEYLDQWNIEHSINQRILPALLYYKAIGIAATEFPSMNGFFMPEKDQANNNAGSIGRFRPAESVNLGIAISLRGGGVIAPCLMDVPKKRVVDLMAKLKDLVNRARTGGLRGSELSDGTLTVSNLGDRGVDFLAGVIYPPQVALVGIGTMRKRPVTVDEQVQIRPMINFSLAADHRVSDGHTGSLFLRRIENLLANPNQLT